MPEKSQVVIVNASNEQVKQPNIGKFIFANGDIYDGEFTLNESGSVIRQGYGTFTCQEGVIYCGNWMNDKMNGKGSYIHPSGMKYEGNFVNGRYEGHGKYFWSNGYYYEGEFKDSKLVGQGYFHDPNKQTWIGKFEGDFANNLKFKLEM